jgi:DTW domain-containing protein YfiP
MDDTPTAKRKLCPRCEKPLATCLCSEITPLANKVQVTIYRHTSEVKKAIGTAGLCRLGLSHCQIVDTDIVKLSAQPDRRRVLLFPPMESITHQPDKLITTPQLCELAAPSDIELIVLDGSWKKARKMYYLSDDLHGLAKLQLSGAYTGAYRIRKAEKPGQYSTLEAVTFALMELEQAPDKYQPLLNLQQAMVNQQLSRMNPGVKARY